MLHLSGRKHFRFLFFLLSVVGVGAVFMLYQEISRLAGEEPRFGGPTTPRFMSGSGGNRNMRTGDQAQLQHQEVLSQADDEKLQQPPIYGESQDQTKAVDVTGFQSNDENWFEYKTDVRDSINDKYYFLLKAGGTNGNSKRSKKVNKDKLLLPGSNVYRPDPHLDSVVYNFESENADVRDEEINSNSFSDNDRLHSIHGRNSSKHLDYQREYVNGVLKYRPSKADGASHNSKLNVRKVLPPAPHSLYRQPHGSARYLVYVCDSQTLCGGWGDRQRGMVSTYFLSRLVGRQLKIIMATPCDLLNFYIPNRVPWVLAGSQLDAFPSVSINAFTNKGRAYVANSMLVRDFNELYPQQVVYIRTNQDYYNRLEKNPFYQDIIRNWSGLADKSSRFQWAWKDLMRPSPRLIALLGRVLGLEFLVRRKRLAQNKGHRVRSLNDLGNNTLICAHVRYGKNPSFPNDNERSMFSLSDLPMLLNFMLSRDSSKRSRFYLASDYQLIKDKAKDFFGDKLLSFGVTVTHIDRQRGGESACEGFESALLDQQILSLCDVLVISRSGFSIHASYMAPAAQQVFIMEDGSIREFNL